MTTTIIMTTMSISLYSCPRGEKCARMRGPLSHASRASSPFRGSLLLRFTSGIILSVVCFDLVADAMEDSHLVPVLCWLVMGYLCTYLLNCWIDKRAHHSHSHGDSRWAGR